jgi:signal transduction histidine kinase
MSDATFGEDRRQLAALLRDRREELMAQWTRRVRTDPAALAVQNQGTPIPPGKMPRLFDPFVHGERAPEGGEGLGLGLFIAHQIVVAHGGAIDVTSTHEEGTTFTVRLPRDEGECPEARSAQR